MHSNSRFGLVSSSLVLSCLVFCCCTVWRRLLLCCVVLCCVVLCCVVLCCVVLCCVVLCCFVLCCVVLCCVVLCCVVLCCVVLCCVVLCCVVVHCIAWVLVVPARPVSPDLENVPLVILGLSPCARWCTTVVHHRAQWCIGARPTAARSAIVDPPPPPQALVFDTSHTDPIFHIFYWGAKTGAERLHAHKQCGRNLRKTDPVEPSHPV